ncbi:MAG: hypothetical protein QOE25_547, partial [Actinomycetota bacterium]|nr:hypothetical protein [Actinomycetota bacterium]
MRQNEPSAHGAGHGRQVGLVDAVVFLAAGGIYAGVRVGAPSTLPTFLGACQRLRESGLPL